MNVVIFRKLPRPLKDEFLPLMEQGLSWLFNPQKEKELIKFDPRLKNSPVGYCALENNHVVGFVGVTDLATRTLEREKRTRWRNIWGSHYSKPCENGDLHRPHGPSIFPRKRPQIFFPKHLSFPHSVCPLSKAGLCGCQTTVIDRVVLDDKILQAYRSKRYMVLHRSYTVLMGKPLTKSETFRQVYGDKFYRSNADFFLALDN